MFGKLVWQKSGDEIKFSPASPDLLAYYVDTLNATNANQFGMVATQFKQDHVTRLAECLASMQSLAGKIPFEIDDWSGDLFDQDYLNRLHRQWVLTGIRYPNLPILLRRMNGLDRDYRDINSTLHLLESAFDYEFTNYDQDQYHMQNIFGSSVLGFDTANIMIGYDNLGRPAYSKFMHFDNNAQDQDTNDFDKLSGLIHFNLNRPLSSGAPREYQHWCDTHNIPVVGYNLCLGNIVDLEKRMADLRKIVIRNANEQNDRFILETCTN